MTEAAKRIGRYQVQEVLGSGAFATVYRAVDERLDDTVAVKVLAENHSINLEIRQRFLAEGKALRRIESPHVIRVHDLGETDAQQPFLVLEHADRGTLTERVHDLWENGWQPTAEDVLAVAEPLARALEAVHRADLVHRDPSPGNVLLATRAVADRATASSLVGEDEKLLLADLGLVKDLALNSGFTSAGGTEGFRAPELRSGPARIDGRADLWSLSALTVWLVTGSPPGDEPIRGTLERAELPDQLAGLTEALTRGLAHDPTDRQPDAATWLAEVTAAVAPTTNPSATATPDGTTPAADTPTTDPARAAGPGTATGEATPADQGAAGPAEEATAAYGRASAWQPPSQPSPGQQAGPPTASSNPSAPDGRQAPATHTPGAPAFGTPAAYSTPGYAAAPDGGYGAPGYATAPAAGHPAPGYATATGASYGSSEYAVAPSAGFAAPGYAAAPPGRSGAWRASPPQPELGWRVWHSLWLLATLPLGLTTWVGYLYIGLQAKRARWLVAAGGYGLGVVVMFFLVTLTSLDDNGETVENSWQNVSAALLLFGLWLGGFVHGLFSNVAWLRWRANQQAQGPPF